MAGAPRHEVAELECAPGELSFLARVGGREQRVSFSTDEGATATGADPVLAACLMPAMRSGGTLSLPAPISPRLMRSQSEYQAVQRAWSFEWEFGDPPLEEVAVVAPTRRPDPPRRNGRVAAFFSAGVDSWSTLLDNPDVTDLIFVRGTDLFPEEARHEALTPEVEARINEVADELGLTLHRVVTDLRKFSDPLTRWESYFPAACMAAAHFLAPRFERVLFANATDHAADTPIGSAWLVDQLWSSEELEVVSCGGRYSRAERTRRIASHPLARKTLRVCWENRDGAYNCGRCRKCLLTMITLEAYDARAGFETFPVDLDLDEIAAIEVDQVVLLALWEDVLDAIRAQRRADLEPAVEALVENSKRGLGLPASYRRRPQPGPAPLGSPARRRLAGLRRTASAWHRRINRQGRS